MTRTARRAIFYSLVGLFIVAGTAIAFYASGWRIDFRTLKTTKVGGVYVRPFPADAAITLDGARVTPDRGLLFQSGTLINNLLPGTHRLTLAKDGYLPWSMLVDVQPSFVTEDKFATLVPRDHQTVASGTIDRFWLLGEDAIVRKNGVLFWHAARIAGTEVAGWTRDFSRALTSDRTGTYFWVNLQNGTSINLSRMLVRSGIPSGATPLIDPESSTNIAVRTGNGLSLVSLETASTTALIPIPASTPVALSRAWIAWPLRNVRANTSTVVLYDRFANTARPADISLPDAVLKLDWLPDGRLGLLQSTGDFFIYDPGAASLQHLASDAKDFLSSDDGAKTVVRESRALEIFDFKAQPSYLRFGFDGLNEITGFLWDKNNAHLFMVRNDRIDILDLADTQKSNIIGIPNARNGQYDAASGALYFIENGEVRRIVFPD